MVVTLVQLMMAAKSPVMYWHSQARTPYKTMLEVVGWNRCNMCDELEAAVMEATAQASTWVELYLTRMVQRCQGQQLTLKHRRMLLLQTKLVWKGEPPSREVELGRACEQINRNTSFDLT